MSWMHGLRHRLRVWLHRDAYAREQAEERRFHRDMEAIHGAPGESAPLPPLPPSDGDPSGGSRFLEAARQDVGYAVRGLVRSPGFTAMALLTLALGIGANAAVFSVVDRLFGQAPAGLSEPDDLRRLYIRLPEHPLDPGMIFGAWHYPAFSAVDEAVAGAGEAAAWTPSSEGTVRLGERELTARTSFVTHDYFSVLGVGAARGRLFGPEEAPIDVPSPVAVVSHAFWERAFGSDPGVLGRTVEMDSLAFTVVGVTEEGFTGLDMSFTDVFFPLSAFPARGQLGLAWYEWVGNYLRAVARLAEGRHERELADRATAGYHRQTLPERGAAPVDSTAAVVPGSIIAARGVGSEAGTREQRQAVSVSIRIAGVSVIVLLIACANVAGLLLVRASRRRREIAVRLALGVSRGRLFSQLATEALVLASLAAGLALLLAAWGGAVLRGLLLPEVQWAHPALDLRTVVFAVTTSLAVGLLSALPPALQSRRLDVGAGLRAGARQGASPRSAFRAGLLVTQAALSIVLLIGAGLFVRSLGNVAALRLGFDVDRVAFVSPGRSLDPEEPVQALEETAARLAGLGGVSGVALARHAPMSGHGMTRISLPGVDSLPPFGPGAFPAFNAVSPDFFAVTGMRIVEGRGFAPGEQDVVVVSETMSRTLWPDGGGLGKCLILGEADGACHPVIGVAEDSRRMRILEDPTLQYFVPREAEATGGVILLRVDPGRWAGVAAAARDALERWFDPRTVRVGRMTDVLEPQLRPWRLGAQLFTGFGALALLVTVVGVYSVMAYAVSQRTHEIGVRMALGARLHEVVRLILGEGFRMVALGVVIGIAVALASGRLVESLLYDVTPRDPPAVAAAAAVLLVTGLAASLVPAWRAARVDPSRTLRQE